MSDNIWNTSATNLALAIRRRDISSEEVIGAFLARIASLDNRTNAFAFVDPDDALRCAREADKVLSNGKEVGPLHGLPVSVKDVIATKGMRTTYGSRLYAENIPAADPEAIARVRRAGGILIGKTNTPEFAHKVLTDSPLHGVTRNRWALDRSCGGSSGGAGVAAAMGFSPLNVATDGAGSCRVPAACCGVVGLKPTMGAIPNETSTDLFGLQVLGVITRTVDDLKLLFETLAGPFAGDPFSVGAIPGSTPLGSERTDILRHLRVRYFPLMGNHHVDAQIEAAIQRTIRLMTDAGANVFEAGDIDWATPAWRILLRAQQASRFRSSYASIKNRIDPSLALCIEEGLNQTSAELQDALLARTALFHRLQGVFNAADVFISPVVATPSLSTTHKADDPVIIAGAEEGTLRTAWYNYTVPINGSGHPAISVPCGYTDNGLPIGLQIVGPWRSESLLIRIAAALETLQPWGNQWPAAATDVYLAGAPDL